MQTRRPGAESLRQRKEQESYIEKQERKLTSFNPNTSNKEGTEHKTAHASVSRVELNEQEDENIVYAADNSTLPVLQKHNQISELLLHQQRASQLPPREIPAFEGDPLKFRMLMQAVWKTRVQLKGTACTTWKDTPEGVQETLCEVVSL